MAKGDSIYSEKRSDNIGSKVGGYARARTQVGFDDDTRAKIVASAKVRNRSFAAEVRALIDDGLMLRQYVENVVIERDAVIEECARAAEQQERIGYEWVANSLWANILKRAGDNVRALKRSHIKSQS